MRIEIKKRVEYKLRNFILSLDKQYSLNKISPILFKCLKEFVLRDGKRVRPTLLILGYLGFVRKPAANYYTSALSIELLHDFMLVHDDIIDKSDIRRGKPSMHKLFDAYLSRYKGNKFDGQDLALVTGDIMYAMGINAFLSIREEPERKERALRLLNKAALYTGCGEFIELISGLRNIHEISKADIYKIYDYKTAIYTFASPLAIGAVLAGAADQQIDRLFRYGIYLGRAFQIKDDILGVFGDEKKIGKSTLTDLQEAKKTILIWHAYRHSGRQDQAKLKKILSRKTAGFDDLNTARRIIVHSGALEFAKEEISRALTKTQDTLASVKMKQAYKNSLREYSRQILSL